MAGGSNPSEPDLRAMHHAGIRDGVGGLIGVVLVPLSLGTQTTKPTAAPVQIDPDVLAAVVFSVHSGLPQT